MKLDPDCVRAVLMAVESLDYGEHTNPDKLHDLLPEYSVEQLEYTCLMLGDGGYLELITVDLPMQYTPGVKAVTSLTYVGHEFIANIRKDTVWNGVKNIAIKIGTTSLSGLSQIAANVVTELIKAQFGLSPVGSSVPLS